MTEDATNPEGAADVKRKGRRLGKLPEHPQRITRTDFSRGEAVLGLTWLVMGALFSLLLEVVYLGTRLPLPGGQTVAFPYMILVAWWFNGVLTKTARLWTATQKWVTWIPLIAWCLGFFALMFGIEVTGDMLVANDIRSVLLLFAGLAGGLWPLGGRLGGKRDAAKASLSSADK